MKEDGEPEQARNAVVLLHPRCHNKHVHGKHRVLVGALLLASCVETGAPAREAQAVR